MLLVSHDRYFVNRVADHLLVIEPERVRVVEGNYDTYAGQVAKPVRRRPQDRLRPSLAARRAAGQGGNLREKPARKRRFPFRKVADLEDEIFERETCLHQLQCELAEPSVLRDGQRVREIKAQIEAEQAAIKTLYEHWEEAAELNW